MVKYQFLLSAILFFSLGANAQQQYIKPNEINVISFNTQNGKKLTVAIDSDKRYIVYRYGTSDNLEFEYPGDLNGSFSKFKLYHYVRNGGADNDGKGIDLLQFANAEHTYIIYELWEAAVGGFVYKSGITITNNKTHKKVDIKGDEKTKNGALSNLFDVNKVQISEDSFGY
jgi:hypothetical protein